MYHNTTNEVTQLQAFTSIAIGQDSVVLEYFKQRPLAEFSPSQVLKKLINSNLINNGTPITSIRRSISDLTKEGKLIKTSNKVPGMFGRPEHTWIFNSRN
jgi:hypothetical protein